VNELARIEWVLDSARNLRCAFEDASSSARLRLETCLHVHQVHGHEIHELTERDLEGFEALARADGIYVSPEMAAKLSRALVIKSADCIPLMLWDSKSQALAAIHAGWRGLAQQIHVSPFERALMDPSSTHAYVGPSLNGDNFEVGPDMWSCFPSSIHGNPRYFAPMPEMGSRAAANERRAFFAWRLLEDQLRALGLREIRMSGVNSLSDPDFASYRRAKREGRALGERNYSWIGFHAPEFG
jgi:copper oxidase (laccase) domain-containing protein